MKIVQAIDEVHGADPQAMLKLEIQNLYKMFPAKEVEDVLFTVVLAIAGATGCFYKIDAAPIKSDSTVYFWSRVFGPEFPENMGQAPEDKSDDRGNETAH